MMEFIKGQVLVVKKSTCEVGGAGDWMKSVLPDSIDIESGEEFYNVVAQEDGQLIGSWDVVYVSHRLVPDDEKLTVYNFDIVDVMCIE